MKLFSLIGGYIVRFCLLGSCWGISPWASTAAGEPHPEPYIIHCDLFLKKSHLENGQFQVAKMSKFETSTTKKGSVKQWQMDFFMNFRSFLTKELPWLFLAIFGDLDIWKGISNLPTGAMSYLRQKMYCFIQTISE